MMLGELSSNRMHGTAVTSFDAATPLAVARCDRVDADTADAVVPPKREDVDSSVNMSTLSHTLFAAELATGSASISASPSLTLASSAHSTSIVSRVLIFDGVDLFNPSR